MSEKCGKILKNIFIDAVVLERDECSIDGETLVLCFLEELGDFDGARGDDLGNAEGNSNWKSLVDTVVQDTGGYSSDVSHDIIADIERQGGEAFLKMALEEFQKASKKLSKLSAKDQEAVERLSKGIVAKLLHGPMNHLRQQKQGDDTIAAIESVKQAFQLRD